MGLFLTCPAHSSLLTIFLLSYHPGARQEIVPAAFFPLPQDPQESQSQRGAAQTHGADPAKQRAAVANRPSIDTYDAQAEQPFPDSFSFHAMERDEVNRGQARPRDS